MRSPLVAAITLLAAVLAGGCARPPAGPPISDEVTVVFRYSHFSPPLIAVPAGVPVTITLRNDDPIEHEWIVGGPEIHEIHRVGTEAYHEGRPTEVTVPPYATRTTTVTFEPTADGSNVYAFVCHFPGHEEYGMTGVVQVAPTTAVRS